MLDATSARTIDIYFIFIRLRSVYLVMMWPLPPHATVKLKDLVLVERVDGDIAGAPGAKRAIDAPRIGVREVKADGIGEHVSGFHGYGLLVDTAVDDVRINQVGIQRVLLGVLVPSPDLPVVLRL